MHTYNSIHLLYHKYVIHPSIYKAYIIPAKTGLDAEVPDNE